MSRALRAARSALVVIAGVVAFAGASSSALAQRRSPRIGRAGSLPPATPAQTPQIVPYPGATVTFDPRFFGFDPRFFGFDPRFNGFDPRFNRFDPRFNRFDPRFNEREMERDFRFERREEPFIFPVPFSSGGFGFGGYGGGVYDTNGRPLYLGYEQQAAPTHNDFPAATPDLSGSPYVVIDGGTMVVDFGNGDRRAVPACAVVNSASTPDGKPRTIFYRPPAYQLILRPGERGQVIGRPTAGARVCYTNDAYGRVVLEF